MSFSTVSTGSTVANKAESALTAMLSVLMLTEQQLREASALPLSPLRQSRQTPREALPMPWQLVINHRQLTSTTQRHLAMSWMMRVLNALAIGEQFTILLVNVPSSEQTYTLFPEPVSVSVDSLLRARWALQQWLRPSVPSLSPTDCGFQVVRRITESPTMLSMQVAGCHAGIAISLPNHEPQDSMPTVMTSSLEVANAVKSVMWQAEKQVVRQRPNLFPEQDEPPWEGATETLLYLCAMHWWWYYGRATTAEHSESFQAAA